MPSILRRVGEQLTFQCAAEYSLTCLSDPACIARQCVTVGDEYALARSITRSHVHWSKTRIAEILDSFRLFSAAQSVIELDNSTTRAAAASYHPTPARAHITLEDEGVLPDY